MGIVLRVVAFRNCVHSCVATIAVALALGAVAPTNAVARDAVATSLEHRGRLDWTRGMLVVTGASAADFRAPTPAVARVRAERRARDQARARLLAEARALRWAGGGRVAAKVDADPAAAARLDRAIARARDEAVDYSGDGSVVVRLALPLEAVRLAVIGAAAPPGPGGEGATAIVVRARSVTKPVLGVALRTAGGDYSGPTVFYRSATRAAADPRAGARPVDVVASKLDGGALVVGDTADVAEWHKSQPLVIVVMGKR